MTPLPFTFPADARPAVKTSPDLQLIVSDYFVVTSYNPLSPSANELFWYIDLFGPHGFIDLTNAGALPPVNQAQQAGTGPGFTPTLGHFLYVYAWTNTAGGQIRVDLSNFAPGLTPTWWRQVNSDVLPGAGFTLNAFEITTAFARVTLTSVSGIVAIWLSIYTSSSRV